jgi:hypothetical protein
MGAILQRSNLARLGVLAANIALPACSGGGASTPAAASAAAASATTTGAKQAVRASVSSASPP